jgi:ASC-1-like (ASCH) protein
MEERETHTFNLSSPWYEFVASGEKVYEGRRRSFKTDAIKTGDMICFHHEIFPPMFKKVVHVHHFTTFEEGLSHLPFQKILPGTSSIEEGVAIYEKYVSIDTQKKDGICLIEIGE